MPAYNDDDDDILYGTPFATADDAESPSTISYTSALRHGSSTSSLQTRPGYRRRGSESVLDPHSRSRQSHQLHQHSASAGASKSRPGTSGHHRSHTADERKDRRDSAAQRLHPLAGLSPTKMDFFGSTRPVLNRMLSDQSYEEPESSKDALGSPLGATYQKEAERTVIVHEVAPTDSLPGVALKYGIALSELRRANQLWPSDPIHLRKTLYIPVDKTSRRDLVEALVSPGPSSPPPINSPTDSPFNRISPHGHPQSPGSPNLPATATIRRIPASRLSFFPPSQSSALNRSKTLPRKFSTPPLSASAPVIPAGRRSPTRSTKASALTSIFNALPINVPRISLDSTRSNTSASDDQEHEMADVSWSVPKTASPFDAFPSFESPRRTGYTPASKPARTTHMRQASKGGLIELDQDPTPGRGPAPVRTAQMEPSPAMTLPLGSRTDMADTKVASRRRIPESFRTRPPDSGIS